MVAAPRKFLIGLTLLIVAGGLIGWLYGNVERGILVAVLIALIWQVRHLLAFLRALRTRDFEVFRVGDGVWQQIFSQFSYENERSQRHKKRYRQLLKEVRKSTDAMPDGAVILDANHEIIMCNRAAKAIAGLKRKKDRGQRVDNILRDPQLTRLLQSEDYSQAIEIPSPVDDDAWLNCRVVPYGPDQKLLFLRDVTDRMRLSRMRRDFVANASHELRSPLTVISGYLDSLADDEAVPRDWVDPILQMQQQAHRMNGIVADLLELSRLESAGPERKNELIDVGGLLAAAKKAIDQPGSVPEIDVRIESTVRLRGSGGEIESLISNLVSNAVRHTPSDGRITLVWRSDADGAELLVEDNGEGIAREHLPRLTERFFRVDRGRSREEGGIGLGLAIVKHILGRHDATFTIDSQLGVGSTFSCHFPPQRLVVDAPIPLLSETAER